MLAVFSVIHVLLAAALVGADPDALGPRRRARRHGLHADLAGRHAHRRAEPDAADDRRRASSSSRTRSCCTACSAVDSRCACSSRDSTTSRACAATRSGRPTSTATSSASRSSRRRSTSTTRTATTSTSATRSGSPGSLITFFEWPRAERGPARARDARVDRAASRRRSRRSQRPRIPTGCACGSTPRESPGLRDVVAIGNPDLYAGLFDEDAPLSFAAPVEEAALIGAGHDAPHRLARVDRRRSRRPGSQRLAELGLRPTPLQDRKYFRSIYFRMPDGDPARDRDRRPGLPRRRAARDARPEPVAAAVARARARDARARADADRVTRC